MCKKEIDHEDTSNMICPYCGFEDIDSWEVDDESGETECGSCEKTFQYSRHVEITYSTSKMPCADDKHEWVKDYVHKKTWEYKNRTWVELPEPTYRNVFICQNCDETKYEETSKAEWEEYLKTLK